MPTCPICAHAVARDQRYCLHCGHRLLAPIVDWRRNVLPAPALAASSASGAPAVARRRAPRPKTAAALVLATLGTGTLLGSAVAPTPAAAGADAAAPIIAYNPPAAAATPSAATAGASGSALPDDVPAPAAAPSPAAPAGRVGTGSAAAGTSSAPTPAPTPAPAPEPTATPQPTPTPVPEGPPAHHVVVVSLTGQDFAHAFAPDSPSQYLAHELPAQGALLAGYRATTTGALANGLSLLAGADTTPEQQADCPTAGDACLLDANAPSLPAELSDSARTWKAYVQGATAPCPQVPRDPFAYMRLADCGTAAVGLDALEADLSSTDLAPALAYVVPDPCHDGREADCPGATDGATGLARADAWLREWVPKITASPAFADDGQLIVLFDGGGLPAPADPAAPASAVGAVVIGFARTGAVSQKPYDHLSLLRTLAGTFSVDPPGHAADSGVQPLGHDVIARSHNVPKAITGG